MQAETELKTLRDNKKKEAEAVEKGKEEGGYAKHLKDLKQIHQDQESLAWYIMKRESELKKLEAMKQTKEDRFNKMVQAAKSLINNEEEEPGQGLPALTR